MVKQNLRRKHLSQRMTGICAGLFHSLFNTCSNKRMTNISLVPFEIKMIVILSPCVQIYNDINYVTAVI